MNVRNIARKLVVPPKYYDLPALNRLGLQVARILSSRFFYQLRFTKAVPDISAIVDRLDRDGCVVIPDFLPHAQFVAIKEEFNEAFRDRSSPNVRLRKSGKALIGEIDVLERDQSEYPLARDAILKSERLRKIIETAARKKVRVPVACILQIFAEDDGVRNANVVLHHTEEFDTENILHQDHCLPVFKAWYYIEDVTDAEGAFVYAPGSHRLNLARLRYEYRKSVHVTALDRGALDSVPSENVYQGRYVPSERDRQEIGLKEISLTGRANSLVIANTVGFHKRGQLAPGHMRKLIHVDFRRLQSRLNAIPFIGKSRRLEEKIRKNRRQETALAQMQAEHFDLTIVQP